ncbi:MAG TPA: hypothetical protein VFW02_06530, partial [Candidatus Limnocylindrales bacterium]|nr:hypothetical protein [Candidatus Limnocylindrales bacterium]
ATRAMPIPSRPRDFMLTRADADRLRVRGWRRVLAAIGSSRDVFSRPLAVGLTTLGLAGLLVATIPGALPGLTGGSASAPVAQDAARNAAGNAPAASPEFLTQASAPASAAPASGPVIAAAPSAAPSEAALPAPAASAADASPEVLVEGGETGSVAGEPDDRGAFDAYLKSLGDEPGGPSPMMVLAALLLVTGLGLFGLRWTARRLRVG